MTVSASAFNLGRGTDSFSMLFITENSTQGVQQSGWRESLPLASNCSLSWLCINTLVMCNSQELFVEFII